MDGISRFFETQDPKHYLCLVRALPGSLHLSEENDFAI
jgi:hypothetical protein